MTCTDGAKCEYQPCICSAVNGPWVLPAGSICNRKSAHQRAYDATGHDGVVWCAYIVPSAHIRLQRREAHGRRVGGRRRSSG
jgi:hypothetical protein